MLVRAVLTPFVVDSFTYSVVAITLAMPAAYQCWLGYALQGLIMHGEALIIALHRELPIGAVWSLASVNMRSTSLHCIASSLSHGVVLAGAVYT